MGVCRKCHREKRRAVLHKHQKKCFPSEKDNEHFSRSRGGTDSDYKKKQHKGGEKE